MAIALSELSVSYFIQGLGTLKHCLGLGQDHVRETGGDAASLLTARLYPDMFTLTQQIQSASDTARRACARLADAEIPSVPDEESTFDELFARIDGTVAYLESVDRAAIDASEDRTIVLPLRGTTLTFSGRGYLLGFAVPNFGFHVSMAYAILRSQGVSLGKQDYLRAFVGPNLAG